MIHLRWVILLPWFAIYADVCSLDKRDMWEIAPDIESTQKGL